MSPASQKQIETQLRNLIEKLPLKEQARWLPRKHTVHKTLRKDIYTLLQDNPRHTYTVRQLSEYLTHIHGAAISTGSVEYHINKLIASQDVYRAPACSDNGENWVASTFAYGIRRIVHLTCIDPAELNVKRTFKAAGDTRYELSLDPYGQTRWVYAAADGTWHTVPGQIKLVLS